jgi:type IV secretion system protein VirD4
MVRIFNVQKNLTMMLSGNTIDIRDFGKKKTAVYIIVPDEKTTYHFLVTTFIKQAYEILISEAQKTTARMLPIRVNFVLDEFCNIPKIPDMPSMISAARSRNMRFYLVAQSIHQLRGRYGEDADTIKGNCDNWVFLTSKELTLLNEISELCGSIYTSDNRHRRLISISELQRFDKEKGEVLIMHSRQYPIITEMADIDMYSIFKGFPTVELKPFRVPNVSVFSVQQLYLDIGSNKREMPFGKAYKSDPSKKEVDDESKRIQAELEKKFDELFGLLNDDE